MDDRAMLMPLPLPTLPEEALPADRTRADWPVVIVSETDAVELRKARDAKLDGKLYPPSARGMMFTHGDRVVSVFMRDVLPIEADGNAAPIL